MKYLKIKRKLLKYNHKTTALFLLLSEQYFTMRLLHTDSLVSLRKHMDQKSVNLERMAFRDKEPTSLIGTGKSIRSMRGSKVGVRGKFLWLVTTGYSTQHVLH